MGFLQGNEALVFGNQESQTRKVFKSASPGSELHLFADYQGCIRTFCHGKTQNLLYKDAKQDG